MNDREATRAPCGCVFGTVDDMFVFEPCSQTCEVYAYAVTEARKQGKALPPFDVRSTGKLEKKPECPSCGTLNDGYTGPKGARPSDGDVAICIRCAEIGVYTSDGDIRTPTPDERAAFEADVQLTTMRRLVKARSK